MLELFKMRNKRPYQERATGAGDQNNEQGPLNNRFVVMKVLFGMIGSFVLGYVLVQNTSIDSLFSTCIVIVSFISILVVMVEALVLLAMFIIRLFHDAGAGTNDNRWKRRIKINAGILVMCLSFSFGTMFESLDNRHYWFKDRPSHEDYVKMLETQIDEWDYNRRKPVYGKDMGLTIAEFTSDFQSVYGQSVTLAWQERDTSNCRNEFREFQAILNRNAVLTILVSNNNGHLIKISQNSTYRIPDNVDLSNEQCMEIQGLFNAISGIVQPDIDDNRRSGVFGEFTPEIRSNDANESTLEKEIIVGTTAYRISNGIIPLDGDKVIDINIDYERTE